MARSKVDAKAKEKRQKIVLAAGGVLLLLLLVIQGPKLMKQLKGSPAPAAAPAATTTTAPGSPAAPPPAQFAALQDTDRSQPASIDTLASLSRFHAKDPFKQQASDTAAPGTPSTPSGAPAQPTQTAQQKTPKQGDAGSHPVFGTVELPSKGPKGDLKPVDGLPQATLRVNGKKAQVALGRSFPKATPLFRLAGFAPGSVKIAVVGGSLADGSKLITLRRRHRITLVNTVNGARYTIELLSTSRIAS
jgi:hypothetical protein